jgi:hypothetical protein
MENKSWFVKFPNEPDHLRYLVDAASIEDAVKKFGIENCFDVEMVSQDTEVWAASGDGDWQKFNFHVEPVPSFTVTKKDGD